MSHSTLTHLRLAHIATGAPGNVVGFFADGRYVCSTRGGKGAKIYRFRTHKDGRVTVLPTWTIAGDRQKRQATR